MKKIIKWMAILFGALVVLIVLALLIVPKFVDLRGYKPLIEKSVEEQTGRTLVLAGDIELSLFPWAGVTLNDVSLGNPKGFDGEGFAFFTQFEIRMKLWPLISKEIEIKHVILKGLQLVLEKSEEGDVNWEFDLGEKPPQEDSAKDEKNVPEEEKTGGGEGMTLPIKSLDVGKISVENGSVIYIDGQSDVRKELTEVNVMLTDISLETPIQIGLSGKLDGKSFSLKGSVGPLGEKPGEGDIPLSFTAEAFDILQVQIDGQVTDPSAEPSYQLQVNVTPFSIRQLIAQVAPETELPVSDTTVLEKFGFEAALSGNTKKVALSKGKIVLDDTTTTLELQAKDFEKPDIRWNVHVDNIDIDRYLPKTNESEAESRKGASGAPASAEGSSGKAGEMDYAPMRSLVLDGNLEIGELKAAGGKFQDIAMKISASGGRFRIEPFSMNLYEGKLVVKSAVDVSGKKPSTSVDIDAEGIEIEPLLKDFIDKDFIAGTTRAKIALSMTGDAPEKIKKTLNGNGRIQFEDGKIRNVNLLGMIQNIQSAFGSGSVSSLDETEFSEFGSDFKITKGVFKTTATTLSSPVLRVDVTGKADLVKETIDFRVNPTYINPKNQKESGMSISGNKVPVLVTGTFAEPKFKPDLETAAKNVVKEKLTEKIGEVLGGSKSKKSGTEDADDTDQTETVEDTVKGLIKNLPFGK